MADSRDHYQVLGLQPDADADEIRQAHRRLVRVLHPDRHHEATQGERALAARRMREINEAWNTLRDPERRRNYDSTVGLSNGHRNGSGGAGSAGARSAPGRPSPTASTRANGKSSASSWTGPGSSSAAGSGAYWRPNGSGRPGGNSRATPAGPEDDGIAVAPGLAFLVRRGPIVVIVAVVLGLFIVTAYVGGGGETRQVQPPPLEACARVIEGSTAVLVPCSLANDGEIVTRVDAALDCPPEAPRYVTVGTDFYCIPTPEQRTEGG